MATLKVDGLDELQKKLKDNVRMDDVKRVVRHNGAELQNRIKEKAVFTGGYSTGETKKSVALEITDGGFAAESGPTTHYAEYIEVGTRFMQSQPFVLPAFNEQKKLFKKDLDKIVK